ncbi:hypothetical protein AB0O34_05485 [Sphaerisporangium sp. NPDC088356]
MSPYTSPYGVIMAVYRRARWVATWVSEAEQAVREANEKACVTMWGHF